MLRELAIFTLCLGSISCASGPKLSVYLSDPAKNGMESPTGFIPYSATHKFICLEPSDLGTLLNYCRQGHSGSHPFWEMFSSGPGLTIYMSDPGMGGMEFHNPRTGISGFIDYASTAKFTCLSPTDTQTLLNYCGGVAQPRSQTE